MAATAAMDDDRGDDQDKCSEVALPRYLRLLPKYSVVLCIEHECCYAADSLGRHLLEKHKVYAKERALLTKTIEHLLPSFLRTIKSAKPPQRRREPIEGLPCHAGYYCRWPVDSDSTASACSFLTRNSDKMRMHYASHAGRSRGVVKPRPAGNALLQTLSTRHIVYFRVNPVRAKKQAERRQNHSGELSLGPFRHVLGLPSGTVQPSPDASFLPDLTADVMNRFDASQGPGAAETLATPAAHVSEATPWLRKTGYDAHLAVFDLETIDHLYRRPKQSLEPVLCLICDAVARVLERAMGALGIHQQQQCDTTRIVDHEARILNTFRTGSGISLDPIRPLQQAKSVRDYITVWQELICYIYRAAENDDCDVRTSKQQDVDALGSVSVPVKTFRLTVMQEEALLELYQAALDMPTDGEAHVSHTLDDVAAFEHGSDNDISSDDGGDELAPASTHPNVSSFGPFDRSRTRDAMCDATRRVDECVVALSQALICDPCPSGRTFDSAIVSFSAVKSWSIRGKGWLKASSCTSMLSRLIYCSQLIILRSCLDTSDPAARIDGDRAQFRIALSQACEKWLHNDGHGPIAELLSVRSFGMAVAKTTVADACFRWDTTTPGAFTYRHINFSLSHLKRLVDGLMSEANRLMEHDLCLGLPDIPRYRVSQFEDNWSTARPGDSFLTDVRNLALVSRGRRWLVESIVQSHSARAIVFKRRGAGVVSSEFASQYQSSVDQFLAHLMMLTHLTSGMPSRRPEYLGLRAENVIRDKRNLFVHNGFLVFILTYHKALNIVNGSRWPVRYLMPVVSELLLRYLLIVQPFRRWLSAEVSTPARVSAYLWSRSSGKPWQEDRMTTTMKGLSSRYTGVEIGVQAWRQMTTGIALGLFQGLGLQLDGDVIHTAGDRQRAADADPGSTSVVPDAVHWQSAHNPRTANQAYGGSVDFKNGVTDAALAEYLRVSLAWHKVCVDEWPGVSASQSRGGGVGARGRQTPQSAQLSSPSRSRRASMCRDMAATSPSPRVVSSAQGLRLTDRMEWRGAPLRRKRTWSIEACRDALRACVGDDSADFLDRGQELAMSRLLSGVPELVVVLPCGAGKSMLYQLPIQLSGAGTTVVVIPLTVLRLDAAASAARMGLEHLVWGSSDVHDEAFYLNCPLIFVSIDKVAKPRFLALLHRLVAADRLDRVVLDECHMLFTESDFRACMDAFKQCRRLACQFVFLSASLPPSLVPEFTQSAMLGPNALIVRAPTTRFDLEYIVTRSPPFPPDEFVRRSANMICCALNRPEFGDHTARAIVYVHMQRTAETLAAHLGCDVFHGSVGSDEAKALILERWKQGAPGLPPIIVATKAFEAGVDYPHVRAVIHVGAPENCLAYSQQVGRGGRDGRGAVCATIIPHSWSPTYQLANDEWIPPAERAMQMFLQAEDPRECRLAVLSEFMDGEAVRCSVDVVQRGDGCDLCRTRSDGREDGADSPLCTSAASPRQDAVGQVLEVTVSGAPSTSQLFDADRRVEAHTMEVSARLQRFVDMLGMVRDTCLICRLLGSSGVVTRDAQDPRTWNHTLDQCAGSQKRWFFSAKHVAKEAGLELRRGWYKKYSGCFGCAAPQVICRERGDYKKCEFRDVVMPLCWAAWQQVYWREQKLPSLARRRFSSENEYMLWLGEERQMYGEPATNFIYVTEQLLIGILGRS